MKEGAGKQLHNVLQLNDQRPGGGFFFFCSLWSVVAKSVIGKVIVVSKFSRLPPRNIVAFPSIVSLYRLLSVSIVGELKSEWRHSFYSASSM